MAVIVVGLNHKAAPIEIREKLYFSSAELNSALNKLNLVESVILSTCNRVEIYGVVNNPEDGITDIKEFLSEFHKITRKEFEKYLYTFSDEEAIRHLLKVSASLDSMVIGEAQIFGQVKEAYFKALKFKSTGTIFNGLFHRVINVVKKVRTDTEIGRMPVSVSSVAVDLAKKIFGELNKKIVLIIGAGKMSELTAKYLVASGVKSVFVSNRSFEKAKQLARMFKGKAVKFDEYLDHMVKADIVIGSTCAPHYVVKYSDVSRLIHRRKNSPMFFIDISVPRNIDPAVNNIDNVYLYNIDDMQEVANENKKVREKAFQQAEDIIDCGLKEIMKWYNSLAVVPTIISLQEKAESLRQEEVKKAISKLNNVSEADKIKIDRLTRSLISKLLREPIKQLKDMAEKDGAYQYTEAIRCHFKLDSKK